MPLNISFMIIMSSMMENKWWQYGPDLLLYIILTFAVLFHVFQCFSVEYNNDSFWYNEISATWTGI